MEEAIYSLVDPRDNLEFYVGRTQDIYQRFIQHLKCYEKNDAKNARILELKALHLLPAMRTLEIVRDDSALSAQREAYWIRHFKYLGIELTNDIVYSSSKEELRKREIKVVSRDGSETETVRRIHKILRKRPEIGPSELAMRVGVTKGYASKVKARFVQTQGGEGA